MCAQILKKSFSPRMFCPISYKSPREFEIGISLSQALLSSPTPNTKRKMFKFIAILFAASAVIGIAHSQADPITTSTTAKSTDPVVIKQNELIGQIQDRTDVVMAVLNKMISDAAASTQQLLDQVNANGKDPKLCSAQVGALAVGEQSFVNGINGLRDAKIAVCKATITLGELGTFGTTLDAYQTAGDNLRITYIPVHALAVGIVDNCYRSL